MTEPAVRLTSGLLRRAAIVSAQWLLIFLALWALRSVVVHLSYVLIPVFVALLLTALIEPLVNWLARHRWPRALAVLGALIAGLVVVGGITAFVVISIIANLDQLRSQLAESFARVQAWLSGGPLHITGGILTRAQQWLSSNQQALMTQVLGAANVVVAFFVGIVIAAVLFLMFLYDGPKMWSFLLRPWRPRTRELVADAGSRAYRGVVVYVRVTALVALIDGIGIGIGLGIVGVPLTVPLAALTFLGAFVPYVGAVVSGVVAIAVTLVSNGPVAALIILGVVLAVQQLEGQVLHPLLQGNFTRLHPAVVLVALVIGGAEGGIAGVLFAVPLLAAVRGVVLAVADQRSRDPDSGTGPPANVERPPPPPDEQPPPGDSEA